MGARGMVVRCKFGRSLGSNSCPPTLLLQMATRGRTGGKGGGRRSENNKIYAHPIPILFGESSRLSRGSRSLLGLSLTEIINPHITGYLDPTTKSVWILNSKDSMILWRRGFFGKGDLSRSEPSWLARQINDQKARRNNRMSDHEGLAVSCLRLHIPQK